MTPKGKELSKRPEESSRRGPRPELSDAELVGFREALVHAFEGYWGEIGLTLRRCKRPDDIIRVFEVFKDVYIWNRVSYFCRRTSERPDWRSVRKLRNSLKVTRGDRYKWDRVAAERKQDWQDAQRALASVKRNRRRLVRRELKKRQRRFAEASQEHRRLHDEEDRLQQQLDHFESAFARQELFEFVKSKRYEVTPLNLANAISGLPYTRWRQSMRRCVSHESTRANGEDYRIFKAIRFLAGTAKGWDVNGLIEHFKSSIPKLPPRHSSVRRELADKWWYLEQAIREALKSNPFTTALPFEIQKHYQRQFRNFSQSDKVIAEITRIPLKTPRQPNRK